MTVEVLLNAVTATGAGAAKVLPARGQRPDRGIVQATITGTATVQLEGSNDGVNWAPLVAFSASDMEEVILPYHVRGNVTARTSGAVTLTVEH